MKAIAIIPARMGASRFPGKPLEKILGIPMVGHCYFRTRLSPGLSETYVATCDQEIADYIRSVGGRAVMTAATHQRATDRTAEAMMKIEAETGGPVDVVVMVQGDEPLILPETIADALRHFDEADVEIVNVMSHLRTLESFQSKTNVKVTVNHRMDALYFSREPIPSPWKGWEHLPRYNQLGVILFRRGALIRFNSTPETTLEKIESVDMNRVLETGGRIRMVLTEATMLGVDTPQELEDVAVLMKSDPVFERYAKS